MTSHRSILLASVLAVTSAATPLFGQTLAERLAKETPAALAAAAREKGNAVRGAILFTAPKLACSNCHAPNATDLLGPDLTRLGDDVDDVHLVEALLQPSKAIRQGFESVTLVTTDGRTFAGRIIVRGATRVVLREASADRQLRTFPTSDVETIAPSAKSSMPDDLVNQLAGRDAFLDLVRYTMELRTTKRLDHEHPEGGGVIAAHLRGQVLLKDYACATCHRDDVTATVLGTKVAPDLAWSSGRIDPRHVERFLLDPHGTKPGTTMPDVLGRLDDDERRAAVGDLTHYLASLNERPFTRQPLDNEAEARGRELFHTVGCVACHSPRDAKGAELLSDDSVPLGPIERKYNRDGLVAFLENPHASRPSGRMPNMQLTHWEAIDVANYLLGRGEAVETEPFAVQSDRAARGRERFTKLGCATCHARTETPTEPTSVPLSKARPDHGCLSGKTGAWPRFDLSDAGRSAIWAALATERTEPTDAEEIDLALTGFRCFNCHQRGTLGGVSDSRNPHFTTTNPNLGPQGRIPPTLTNVGAKLNAKWLRQVLVGGRSIRPYVRTRMPRFGAENVAHLVERFERVDRLPEIAFAEVGDQKEMRNAGAEMAGTGGLNCIACHTFQLKKAANMPAVDLTEMAERLRKPWFYHYMKDPQRLSRNTIMPSFWPGGRAMRKDILEGDADRQIEALWQYLLDGRQARTPRGLIREPIELLAGDEAVMLRRAYPGIGKRGIGVGYPRGVNLAFDAEQMRLAMLWQGKFADPGGVWRSQGHGQVRPLGTDLVRFTTGPDLDDAQSPWVVDEGRPPHHRFRGYTLDEKQRPRFRYEFGDIAVEDYAVDVLDPSGERGLLRRTITTQTEKGTASARFRAADGKRIVAAGRGEYVVDGLLRVRIVGEHESAIVDIDGGQRLHVPITATAEPATLTIEYEWEVK